MRPSWSCYLLRLELRSKACLSHKVWRSLRAKWSLGTQSLLSRWKLVYLRRASQRALSWGPIASVYCLWGNRDIWGQDHVLHRHLCVGEHAYYLDGRHLFPFAGRAFYLNQQHHRNLWSSSGCIDLCHSSNQRHSWLCLTWEASCRHPSQAMQHPRRIFQSWSWRWAPALDLGKDGWTKAARQVLTLRSSRGLLANQSSLSWMQITALRRSLLRWSTFTLTSFFNG